MSKAFSNQEGIGSRLQHLLFDFFMIDSISLIDTGEKSDKLYGAIDGATDHTNLVHKKVCESVSKFTQVVIHR